MIDLPDANAWVALMNKRHEHHHRARLWWSQEAAETRAFCRVTMMAFLRVSSNPKAVAAPLSIAESWQAYHELRAQFRVTMLLDPANLEERFEALTSAATFRHKLWTDAYLASFAIEANCRLVSFDSDFYTFPGLNFLHLQ